MEYDVGGAICVRSRFVEVVNDLFIQTLKMFLRERGGVDLPGRRQLAQHFTKKIAHLQRFQDVGATCQVVDMKGLVLCAVISLRAKLVKTGRCG
jgi:hypothetical protein